MAAQALYRRWRPQSFQDVIGQEHVTQTLRNAIAGGRLAHAYLFTGMRGTGKTSVARILAKAVNCTGEGEKPCNACAICQAISAGRALDLIEIDAASNTGVDDVRELREKIGFAPNEATYKVYVLDEAHMLSTAAFNALLKTLEEPPPHAIFILATTEPHKIPATIVSRCQRFDFRRVPIQTVVGKLEQICAAEGIRAERAALDLVARSATGSIRDAESLLDQLAALGEEVTVDHVRACLGTPDTDAYADLVDALVARDTAAGLRVINEALDRGADPRPFQSGLLEYLRELLLIQTGVAAELLNRTDEALARMGAQAARLPTPALVATLHRVNDARPPADRSQPSLPLELAFVESVLGMNDAHATIAGAAPAAGQRPEVGSVDPVGPVSAPRTGGAVAESVSEAAAPAKAAPAVSIPKPEDPAAPDVEPAPSASPPTPASTEVPAAGISTGARTPPGKELARVRSEWDAVVALVGRQDKNSAALLRDCRPVDADESSVTLGFYYEFHCQRMSEKGRSDLVAAALEQALGAPMIVICKVVPPTGTDERTRPRTKSDQAKTDPVVRHAIEELGGRIADFQSTADDP